MSPSLSDTWHFLQTVSCSHQEGAKKCSNLAKLHSTLVWTLGILLKLWHVLPACGAVSTGSKWVVLEQHSWVRHLLASAWHQLRGPIELSSKTYLASLVFLWREIQMGRTWEYRVWFSSHGPWQHLTCCLIRQCVDSLSSSKGLSNTMRWCWTDRCLEHVRN